MILKILSVPMSSNIPFQNGYSHLVWDMDPWLWKVKNFTFRFNKTLNKSASKRAIELDLTACFLADSWEVYIHSLLLVQKAMARRKWSVNIIGSLDGKFSY